MSMGGGVGIRRVGTDCFWFTSLHLYTINLFFGWNTQFAAGSSLSMDRLLGLHPKHGTRRNISGMTNSQRHLATRAGWFNSDGKAIGKRPMYSQGNLSREGILAGVF